MASLGAIAGQVRLDITQAIAAFATLRTASAASTGAMTTAGTRMSTFGKASTVAGLALVAAFSVAINKAADFEKKMDYFGAVNNATAKEMEGVRKKALELGKTSQYSASQIADAFVELAKAGVSAQDITNGMADAMVNLASAADIDLAQATNIVTSQIQAYGLAAKDAVHVTDLMAGAANASIIDVEDIGVSMKYVAGVAHSLGISIDSTTEAISLLGKAGIKGSTAGTSLRQIMVSLAGATNKAQGVLEDLGIITLGPGGTTNNAFFDATGKAKDLATVFQILQDHTVNLTQKERLMAFRTIFNNRALAASSILTKAGSKGFKEMADEMSKTTAADVAAKRMDNLSGDIKHLKGNIDTLLIQAGTPFQNFLRGIVQGLTRVIQVFARLPAGVQTGIMAFIGVAGVILTFVGAVALIGGTVLKAIAVFKQLWGAMKLLWVITKALTVATWEQTVAALSNPYVLLAMAVVALIVGLVVLYKKSKGFQALMDAIGRGLKTGFIATVNWFKTLPKFFSGLWKDITHWFEVGVGWVKKNWDLLLIIFFAPIGIIVTVIRRFGADIVNFLKAIPARAVALLKSAWDSFVAFLVGLPRALGYALGFALGTLVRWGIQVATWGLQAGTAIVMAIVWFFVQLPVIIYQWLTKTWNDFVQWGTNMAIASAKAGVDVYHGIINFFQKLPGRAWALFLDLNRRAIKAWSDLKVWAGKTGSSVFNAIVNFFARLPGRIWTLLSNLYTNAVRMGGSIINWATSLGSRAYNGIANALGNLPGLVWGILGKVRDAFLGMVSSAFNAAKSFAGGLWDGFKDGLGIHSPSHIERAMWAITKVTGQESTKLGKQVSGLQSMAGAIDETNPARSTAALSTATMSSLTSSMVKQAAMLQAASASMFPSAAALGLTSTAAKSSASSSSATSQNSSLIQRSINVTVNNPIAERASDSTARKLRQLADMGAL